MFIAAPSPLDQCDHRYFASAAEKLQLATTSMTTTPVIMLGVAMPAIARCSIALVLDSPGAR
jgi:hypothetical protein